MLYGHALDTYKQGTKNICWWCGDVADSREHKYKVTDLKHVKGDDEYVLWGSTSENRMYQVRGVGAKAVKFPPNLCKLCNNQRSQPFDVAYDKYSAYVRDNLNDLRYQLSIDFRKIYGDDWQAGTLNLMKYLTKNFGCRIDEAGFQVPRDLAYYLDSDGITTNMSFAIFKDIGLFKMRRYFSSQGIDSRGLYHGPMIGRVNPNDNTVHMFATEFVTSAIGVLMWWNAGSGATSTPSPVAPLADREDLPHPEVRVLLMDTTSEDAPQ